MRLQDPHGATELWWGQTPPPAVTTWTTLGKGHCASTSTVSHNIDPKCKCTGSPGQGGSSLVSLGFGASTEGGQCDPSQLINGQQWCYVDRSCPTATYTGQGLYWAHCPPAGNSEKSVTTITSEPEYISCRVSSLEECQARCDGKVLKSICQGVSYGSSSGGIECRFYINRSFSGMLPGQYLNDTACSLSTTTERALITTAVAPAAAVPQCYGESCYDEQSYTKLCECSGIVDTNGLGASCSPNSLTESGQQWCYVDTACPSRTYTSPTGGFSGSMPWSTCPYASNPNSVPHCYVRRHCSQNSKRQGQWVQIGSSNVDQTVVYQAGARISHSTTDVKTLTVEMKSSFSFNFLIISGSTGSDTSRVITDAQSNSFNSDSMMSISQDFGPGVVWQWQFDYVGDCASATLFTHAAYLSPSADEPPCCLPGLFDSATGTCLRASEKDPIYDLCKAPAAPAAPAEEAGCFNRTADSSGKWIPISSSSGEQNITLHSAITSTHGSPAPPASPSPSTDFTGFLPIYWDDSNTQNQKDDVSNSATNTTIDQLQELYTFGPGVVWQWQLRSVDMACSHSKLVGHDVRVTSSLNVKPQCVPGYELSIVDPDGPCKPSFHARRSYSTPTPSPSPTPTPPVQPAGPNQNCKCVGQQIGSSSPGAQCNPLQLHLGNQWCYVSSSCPDSTQSQVHYNLHWAYCPPAFNNAGPPKNCSKVIKQQASWVPVASSSSEQTLTYSLGRTSSNKASSGSGSSSKLGFNIGVGFNVGPVHVSVGVAVGTNSAFTRSTDNTFQISSGQSFASTFGAGVVWQWQWSVETECTNHTVFAQDLRLTNSLEEPPCCIPGYEKDISKPHGSCQATNDVTISTCPSFPGTFPIPAIPAPPAAAAANWLKLGRGFCCTQSGMQPKFVRCSGVKSVLQCKQLCALSGTCQGVNYANGSFSGFSWFGSEPAVSDDCFLYMKPGEEVPASLPHDCSVSSGSHPQEAIVQVQPPTSTNIYCLVLEDNGKASGHWQPIMSSNGHQSVSYQYGTVDTTANYYERDSKSSNSWNVGITAFFLSVGLDGGSGMSNLNGHLSQAETTSESSFVTQLGSGVVWQWQLRFTSSYREVIAHGKHLRLTKSLAEPPCCLPGLESNIQDPHSADCLQTDMGKSQNLCVSPPGQPAAVLGMASLSWLDTGHGMCATQYGSQPSHYDCTSVQSMLECTSLCQFSGVCAGVNFDGQTCALYIEPQMIYPELPSSINNCVRAKGPFHQSAITGVNYGAAGTTLFADTSCLSLLNCSHIVNRTGEWVQLASSEGTDASTQVVSFQFGTEQASGTAHSKEFAHSAHNSFSLGFGIGAFGISFGVSNAMAQHSVALHRDAFFKTSAVMESLTFDAGTIWQFQFKASTPCGTTTIRGKNLLLTPSTSQPPCCLPGMEMDLAMPHEKCRPASDGTNVDLCQHLR